MSLGNENLVFARDTNNNVYSFDPASGALTQDSDVSAVIHIATTNDGSLWHAKSNDADMHREIVASGAAPEAISVNQGVVTSVEKVAATGFGAAHCLAQDNKGNPQVYRYNSPYVFKTAMPYDTGSWSLCPTYRSNKAQVSCSLSILWCLTTIRSGPVTHRDDRCPHRRRSRSHRMDGHSHWATPARVRSSP